MMKPKTFFLHFPPVFECTYTPKKEHLQLYAIVESLKGLGHAILGNFSIDQMVIKLTETRCFREAYTGLPVVRATENQNALNCVVLKYSIPVSEE